MKINPNQSLKLWKHLSLRLMVKRFQRWSQVQFPSCWPWPGDGGKPQKAGTIFYGVAVAPRDTKQRFSFDNWRRAWLVEMVKNGTEKGFIFHAITPALYPFWWKFYWLSYSTFMFSVLESQSWKKQNSNQNEKVEKMVLFVKTFDCDHHKFNFGTFFSVSCKTVKEFETEI